MKFLKLMDDVTVIDIIDSSVNTVMKIGDTLAEFCIMAKFHACNFRFKQIQCN